tara:strand:- start:448 stop:1386 length:939 start_codon:yes stop_codon:yes gene_type:complete
MTMKKLVLGFLLSFGITAGATAEEFTVLLDWFVNPDHGPLFVALERGEFKNRGLDVELIAPADPSAPPKLIAAGQGDVAISYQPQLHLQVEAGLPIKRIGTLIATPLNSIVVLADSPIHSISDLKGRKVGFSVGGFEDVLLGAILEKNGLRLSDIELINVNFSLSPSLMSGQVDAVIGAYRNFELNQMELEGRPGRAFYLEEEGIPTYDELIMVANLDKVDKDSMLAFLEAIESGIQFMINHPEKSWELFIKGRPDLDDELNRRAWRDTLPRFALRPAALDRGRYQRFADFLVSREMINTAPPVDTYAVEIY